MFFLTTYESQVVILIDKISLEFKKKFVMFFLIMKVFQVVISMIKILLEKKRAKGFEKLI